MIIEITAQEAWKVIDAIKAYPENYVVNNNIANMFKKIQKDLESAIKSENLSETKSKKQITSKTENTKKRKGHVTVSTGKRTYGTQAVVGRKATKKSD